MLRLEKPIDFPKFPSRVRSRRFSSEPDLSARLAGRDSVPEAHSETIRAMSYDPPRPYRPHLVSPTVSFAIFPQPPVLGSSQQYSRLLPRPTELRFVASSTVYDDLVRRVHQLARSEQGEVAFDAVRSSSSSSSGSSTAIASRRIRTTFDIAETASSFFSFFCGEGTSAAPAAAVAPPGSGRSAAAADDAAAAATAAARRAGEARYVLCQNGRVSVVRVSPHGLRCQQSSSAPWVNSGSSR